MIGVLNYNRDGNAVVQKRGLKLEFSRGVHSRTVQNRVQRLDKNYGIDFAFLAYQQIQYYVAFNSPFKKRAVVFGFDKFRLHGHSPRKFARLFVKYYFIVQYYLVVRRDFVVVPRESEKER
jgi:hypothetical protein